ncbi:hypothetical protein DENIS_3412 [Desulfonema ishimotonii]|uniref:Uncharacterized protein n=1 Tax=Desulfonema ishimotonii TaxID=45657 RepID=A0A401FZQ6_9BACT|nr:hypothetical protein [Desulfonema ishimotonii]GBC62440.1 hypothetical protein DENIS_3412 [Desulfonema ishimotonii]
MKRNGERGNRRQGRENKIVVEGIITAADWDEDGNITGIQILTTDDEAYGIENSDPFMNLVQKSVQASGSLKRGRGGEQNIYIRKISLLEDEPDDEMFRAEFVR